MLVIYQIKTQDLQFASQDGDALSTKRCLVSYSWLGTSDSQLPSCIDADSVTAPSRLLLPDIKKLIEGFNFLSVLEHVDRCAAEVCFMTSPVD